MNDQKLLRELSKLLNTNKSNIPENIKALKQRIEELEGNTK